MGTFQSFLTSKSITPKQIAITSKRVETRDEASRDLMQKRWNKRVTKETADKKYSELNIAKPAHAGRGVSAKTVEAAAKDVPVARKVRSKILKAVNVILAKKGQPAADMKALFEGTKARAGKKPVAEEKKK
jgi:RecA-family ATPase